MDLRSEGKSTFYEHVWEKIFFTCYKLNIP
jgi:hypothetical protein